MKKYMRTIGKRKKIDVSLELDFTDSDGVRHPRNVLFHWTEEELWDKLKIKIIDDEVKDTDVSIEE